MELQNIFKFSQKEIRVCYEGTIPWFVAKDVAHILRIH